MSKALDYRRDRLPEADAHRRDPEAGVPPLELADQRRGDPYARRAEGMAERDPAAVRVDVVEAVLEPGVARELEHDGREGLVDLDHADLVPREPRLRERALARLRVPVQHPVGVDAGEP